MGLVPLSGDKEIQQYPLSITCVLNDGALSHLDLGCWLSHLKNSETRVSVSKLNSPLHHLKQPGTLRPRSHVFGQA